MLNCMCLLEKVWVDSGEQLILAESFTMPNVFLYLELFQMLQNIYLKNEFDLSTEMLIHMLEIWC